jgi:ATP synthase protein I
MTDTPPEKENPQRSEKSWEESVERKEQRKIRARSEREHSVWFGFGMFGMVGWSIAVPTLLGIFIGVWIDNTWPSQVSWTLMLMFAGLVIGCLNAWNWVNRESGMNRQDKKGRKDGER